MKEEQQSMTVREPQELAQPPPIAHEAATTPAQARVEHVAALLGSAYAKASTLTLAPEEVTKLTADFPDDAVLMGAGGDNNLLYIEHSAIRRRLASVFSPGQWSLINRRTWLDEGAGFMYADCVLVIRGCYVGEAIGAQRYSTKNARLNYSDAVEGAQSEALRRIAGKYLDCGIQVWSKKYCEDWKARRSNSHQAAPAKPKAPIPAKATEKTRAWMLVALEPYGNELLLEYAQKNNVLLPTESLTEWPLDKVPTSQDGLRALMQSVEVFQSRGAPPEAPESWRTFPMPFGKQAGVNLEDLEKKYLFGLWANYEVETEYNGKPKNPDTIERDQLFRQHLDAAGEHYEFQKPD